MNSQSIDDFSTRLNRELAALSWKDRSDLLIRVGRMELRMRSDGQERPVWRGPDSEDRLLGADVVVSTEHGEQRGRVICFGVMNMGSEYERSVVVRVPSSGTQHEVPGSQARIANTEESSRIVNEVRMAERLADAIETAADHGPTLIPGRPRKRGQRDPALIERMLAAASAHRNVRSIEDGVSSHKVTGIDAGKRLYVFKNQLRVDVSGFSFDHSGLRAISDEEARVMHLGKVRGQLLFDDREQALAAFGKALEGLK